MRKEGLLYPTCLSVLLGWGVFFAAYEYLARDAEIAAIRSREILASLPAVPGKSVKEKEEDDLADVALLEHRRKQVMNVHEEARRTTHLAAMASAVIAAAAGVLIFAIAKPPRAKRKRKKKRR